MKIGYISIGAWYVTDRLMGAAKCVAISSTPPNVGQAQLDFGKRGKHWMAASNVITEATPSQIADAQRPTDTAEEQEDARLRLLTRENVAAIATDLEELEERINDAQAAAVLPDGWTMAQARALGWLEGAADVAGQTVLEFVDDWT